MSSGVLRISQQHFFSTHNALQEGALDDSAVRFVLHELNGDRHGALKIHPFYDVQVSCGNRNYAILQMVKRLLIKKLCLPSGTLVKDLRILYKGLELPNYRTMDSYINQNDRIDQRLYWCLRESNPTFGIRPSGIKVTAKLSRIINEVALAMKRNVKPKLTMEGTGGTYFLYNKRGKCCAIFKPIDEEAFAPFNPRGYQGKMYQHGFRSGVLSGEGASREVAAYLLDAAYGGMCRVPDTTMVEASHYVFKSTCDAKYIQDASDAGPKWKTGSLQEYVHSHDSSGDYHPGLFSRHDVHRIGIFDLRVLNLDRNDGNILVQPNYGDIVIYPDDDERDRNCQMRLIPIDHGLILPDVIDVTTMDLVWYEWPQTKMPFYKVELELICAFDPDKDAERLHRRLTIRRECLRTMRVTTRLVQIGAIMHLTLHQIANVALRHDLEQPSELERLIKVATEYAFKATDATALISYNRFGVAMDVATSLDKVVESVGIAAASRQGTGTSTSTSTSTSTGDIQVTPASDSLTTSLDEQDPKARRQALQLDAAARAGAAIAEIAATNLRLDTGGDGKGGAAKFKSKDAAVNVRRRKSGLQRMRSDYDDNDFGIFFENENGTISASATSGLDDNFTDGDGDGHGGYTSAFGIASDDDHDNTSSREAFKPFDYRNGRVQIIEPEKDPNTSKRKILNAGGTTNNTAISVASTKNTASPLVTSPEPPSISYKTLTRTTYRRRLAHAQERSIWTLTDSRGQIVHVEWDAQFEHCFYSMIEKLLAGFIAKKHPKWQSQPFCGTGMETFSWAKRQQQQQQGPLSQAIAKTWCPL